MRRVMYIALVFCYWKELLEEIQLTIVDQQMKWVKLLISWSLSTKSQLLVCAYCVFPNSPPWNISCMFGSFSQIVLLKKLHSCLVYLWLITTYIVDTQHSYPLPVKLINWGWKLRKYLGRCYLQRIYSYENSSLYHSFFNCLVHDCSINSNYFLQY